MATMWQFMSRNDMTRDNMSQLEAWRLWLVAFIIVAPEYLDFYIQNLITGKKI